MAEQHTANLALSEMDLDITERVVEAIDADGVVRELRVPVEVSVENGVVTVSGVVRTETVRQRVLFAAATTPGVEKVIDRLVSDREIEEAIAGRLASDSTLGGRHIEITSYAGQVTLVGRVDSEDERQQAISLALETPGVRRVMDQLAVATP